MFTIFTKIFRKFKKTPKIWGAVLVVLVASLIIWPLAAAAADTATRSTGDSLSRLVAQLIGTVCLWLIQNVLGSLILVMVNILIWISSYNDFANSLAVVNGWVVVRDIANMFFIVVLLVIAFGTILGQEEYSYKKLLPKLVVMALLINFSRTLAGLMIDAAQVVMITFVNGYSAAAGGNFINALRLTEIMKFNDHYFTASTMDEYHIAAAALFGVIILIVVNIVITVIVAVLAMRIVMLWLLIVLAPIAWLLGTFPQGQKYYSQWWDEFRNQVVVGPALAFFLWLSLATVGSGRAFDQVSGGRQAPVSDAGNSVVVTQVGAMDSIISLIIALGMLLAGMKVAQDMGGAIAGVMSKAKSAAIKGMALGAKLGLAPAAFGAKWGLARADDAQAKYIQQKLLGGVLGQRILGGSSEMLNKLSIHGVQMRTIPQAWKLRSERVEKERLREAPSVAYDLMNRIIPLRRSKSDFTEIAQGEEAEKKAKEYALGGDDKDILLYRLREEVLDNKGRVRYGKEADAEAIMSLMTKRHDFNELIKSPEVSKMVFGTDQPPVVNAENAKKLTLHMFGDNQRGRRVLNRMGEIGLANTDEWLYNISKKDEKTGQYVILSPEEQAMYSARYAAKRMARTNANNQRGQSFFNEYADAEGNRYFRDIHQNGDRYLRYDIPGETRHFGYMQAESRDALLANIDQVYDFVQRPDLNPDQRKGISELIQYLRKGEKKQSDPLAVFTPGAAPEEIAKERKDIEEFALANRDVVAMEKVQKARGEYKGPQLPPEERVMYEKGVIDEPLKTQAHEATIDAYQGYQQDPIAGAPALAAAIQNLTNVISSKVNSLDAVGKSGIVNPTTGNEMSHAEALKESELGKTLANVFDGIKLKLGEADFNANLQKLLESLTPQSAVREYRETADKTKVEIVGLEELLQKIEEALEPDKRKALGDQFVDNSTTIINNMMPAVNKIPAKAEAAKVMTEVKKYLETLRVGLQARSMRTDDIIKLRRYLNETRKKI